MLAGIAEYEGAIERSLQHASSLLDEGAHCLATLDQSAYREGLNGILEFLGGLLDSLPH